MPAWGEDPAAQPCLMTRSLRGTSASFLQGSDQQQRPREGAPAVSHLEVAREAPANQRQPQFGSASALSWRESASEAPAAPAAQGQPQRGRAPGPSQPDSESQAAGALADLRLESAPRRRLPTSRSLCYGEGPAMLDERCIGSDARSAAADKRCNGRASSPADERCGGRASSPADEGCDGRPSSPAAEGSGHVGSAAVRARAGARCSASSAGSTTAPENRSCSGAEPTQEPIQGAWRLEDAQSLVVYGLGSLVGGPAPRYQLALALQLAARMPALQPPIQVSVHDMVACSSAPRTQPC